MDPIIPPPKHGWAALLRLVDEVRHLAFDKSLPASEALGRIRDTFRTHDEGETTP